MTNDNKFKPTFKQPFIPKTETRIFLGGRPIEQANQTEKPSFSGQNKQHYQSERVRDINPGYGPCSYSGCPWPSSVPCCMEINIEGINRKWARRTGNGDWLSGYWEPGNFDSNQLSRRSLILDDVNEFRKVLPLLSNDSVYTLNFWGKHCAEDTEFCNVSMDIIRKGIAHHESGYKVDEKIMLDSDISKWSRWGLRVAGSAAVGAVFGPGAAAGAYLASEASRVVGLETRASRFFGAVGSNVGDAALDAASGIAEEFGGSLPNLGFVGEAKNILKHFEHVNEGRRYDPDNCPICRPW